jgi:hypothetical protein
LIRPSRRSSAKSVTAMPEAGLRTAAIPFIDLKTVLGKSSLPFRRGLSENALQDNMF